MPWLLTPQAHLASSLILELSNSTVSIRETLSSLKISKAPIIVLGNDSLTDILGKGRIDLDHGFFKDVLYVPGIASNILSVYQMNHTWSPKKVILSLDDV